MDQLRQSAAALGSTWSAWPMARRVSLVASLVTGLGLFSLILVWGTHQSYVPLLTNLTTEDASEIVERLQTDHVPFQIAAGGTAILVPEDQVHALRLHIAGEGLPKGGTVGFEIFDTPTLGMSRFAEQLNYRRALEGELRRTIRQLDGVRDARVHIVVPEQGMFRDQDQQATASVTLHVDAGRKPTPHQVQAVVHLVASAVAGLNPGNITVVDSAGGIMAKGGEAEAQLDGALEHQRTLEQNLEKRVQGILEPIVGAGHVVVRATATLDYSHNEKTSESYDPQSAVVRSEQFSEEHSNSDTKAIAPGGIAGARSNLSGTGKPKDAVNGRDRRLETRNYELTKTVLHEVSSLGRVTRLSVAVLVDGILVTAADGSKKMQERSADEIARLNELVRRTVGFDPDRDDQITVQSMTFEQPAAEASVDTPDPIWMRYIERLWVPVLAVVVGAVVVMIGLSVLRQLVGRRVLPPQVFETPRTVRELEQALNTPNATGAALGAMAASEPMSPLAAANAPKQLPAATGTPQLAAAAATAGVGAGAVGYEPARAANVLKSWLSEG